MNFLFFFFFFLVSPSLSVCKCVANNSSRRKTGGGYRGHLSPFSRRTSIVLWQVLSAKEEAGNSAPHSELSDGFSKDKLYYYYSNLSCHDLYSQKYLTSISRNNFWLKTKIEYLGDQLMAIICLVMSIRSIFF